MIKQSSVVFVSEKLENLFESINDGGYMKKHIINAISVLKKNAFTGIRIPKKLFPKEYILKYGITNLWKYDLPDGWRLMYTLTSLSRVEIVSIILEWFDHKDYERRFGY